MNNLRTGATQEKNNPRKIYSTHITRQEKLNKEMKIHTSFTKKKNNI